MEGHPQGSAVQTFRLCVAHLCLLLGEHLKTVSPVLHTFLAHHMQSGQPLITPSVFLDSIDASCVYLLHRAWCRVSLVLSSSYWCGQPVLIRRCWFKVAVECVRSRELDCINTLVEWLNTHFQNGFPTGLSCAVESIGIYVLLRSIHQANHFDNKDRVRISCVTALLEI